MLHSLLEFGSAVAAIVAAILWYQSAKVPFPEPPMIVVSVHNSGSQIAGEQIVSAGSSSQIDELGRAMIQQGRLSARAAVAAAIAAALQGVALLIPLNGA